MFGKALLLCLLGIAHPTHLETRGSKVDVAVRHFENFWQFNDLVQVLLCAD